MSYIYTKFIRFMSRITSKFKRTQEGVLVYVVREGIEFSDVQDFWSHERYVYPKDKLKDIF